MQPLPDADSEENSIRYSQNFVDNPSLIAELLDESSISTEDTVYEIGAGTGVITAELVKRCRQVIAFEVDGKLVADLKDEFAGADNVEIVEADFLGQVLPAQRYKVFSNIPFNITADIVRKLLEAENPPEDCYLFVQWEAAKKFMGKPFAKRESQFSVLTKPWFDIEIVHHFDQTDFMPIPAVEVVLLRIKRRLEPLIRAEQRVLYRDFIVYAFSANKPSLRQGLSRILTHLQFGRLAKDLRFDLRATPTELDFRQWLGVFKYFSVGVDEERRRLVINAEARLKKHQEKLNKVHRTSATRKL